MPQRELLLLGWSTSSCGIELVQPFGLCISRFELEGPFLFGLDFKVVCHVELVFAVGDLDVEQVALIERLPGFLTGSARKEIQGRKKRIVFLHQNQQVYR
jgi:hypothetical protein